MYYAAVRDSRTSGHHKEAPGRGGSAGGWNLVERVSRPTRCIDCGGEVSAREKIISNYIAARRFHLRQRAGSSSSYYEDHARRRIQPPGVWLTAIAVHDSRGARLGVMKTRLLREIIGVARTVVFFYSSYRFFPSTRTDGGGNAFPNRRICTWIGIINN